MTLFSSTRCSQTIGRWHLMLKSFSSRRATPGPPSVKACMTRCTQEGREMKWAYLHSVVGVRLLHHWMVDSEQTNGSPWIGYQTGFGSGLRHCLCDVPFHVLRAIELIGVAGDVMGLRSCRNPSRGSCTRVTDRQWDGIWHCLDDCEMTAVGRSATRGFIEGKSDIAPFIC